MRSHPSMLVRILTRAFLPLRVAPVGLGATTILEPAYAVPIGRVQAERAGSFGPVAIYGPFGVTAGKLLLVAVGQTAST